MMKKTNTYSLLIHLICFLGMISYFFLATALFAKSDNCKQGKKQNKVFFCPSPPGKRAKLEGVRAGAASRGECFLPQEVTPLTALSPSSKSNAKDELRITVFSLTTQERPSFWFYVPHLAGRKISLKFSLNDQDGNSIDRQIFTDSKNQSGIIQVTLSDNVDPLMLDHPYNWFFTVFCNSQRPVTVQGWITRTHLDSGLENTINQSSKLDRIKLYATNGIWQDALTHLGELYRDEPQNFELEENWHSLLKSVDLDNILTKQLLDCCTGSTSSTEEGKMIME